MSAGFWFDELGEFSPIYILLRYWVPVLITVIFGGIAASVIVPRLQDRYLARKSEKERWIALSELCAASIAQYITSWRRLLTLAHARKDEDRPNQLTEIDRLVRETAKERSNRYDDLITQLSCLYVYASDSKKSDIEDFISWNEELSAKEIDDIVDIDAFRAKQKIFLKTLMWND